MRIFGSSIAPTGCVAPIQIVLRRDHCLGQHLACMSNTGATIRFNFHFIIHTHGRRTVQARHFHYLPVHGLARPEVYSAFDCVALHGFAFTVVLPLHPHYAQQRC